MLSHSKKLITAFGVAAIASAGWMAGDLSARADSLPLAGAPLVCAKGFKSDGNQNGYTCTSEPFKCNAGMSILTKNIHANRAKYVCGFPAG